MRMFIVITLLLSFIAPAIANDFSTLANGIIAMHQTPTVAANTVKQTEKPECLCILNSKECICKQPQECGYQACDGNTTKLASIVKQPEPQPISKTATEVVYAHGRYVWQRQCNANGTACKMAWVWYPNNANGLQVYRNSASGCAGGNCRSNRNYTVQRGYSTGRLRARFGR